MHGNGKRARAMRMDFMPYLNHRVPETDVPGRAERTWKTNRYVVGGPGMGISRGGRRTSDRAGLVFAEEVSWSARQAQSHLPEHSDSASEQPQSPASGMAEVRLRCDRLPPVCRQEH